MTGVVSEGLHLEWRLARPPTSAARDATRNGLVIAHPLPLGIAVAAAANSTFAELGDRVAQDTGWAALTFAFRGAGRSPGNFSPGAWLTDFQAAIAFLGEEVGSVWLAGFGFGGTLAVRAAALDSTVGGVAVLGAPSDLSSWINDPAGLATAAHEAGFTNTSTPDDLASWAGQLRLIDPLGSAALIQPRPMLVVHGSADETVPLLDARALADAAEGYAEMRVVAMAGNRLRHDPRAVALLLGWMQRNDR